VIVLDPGHAPTTPGVDPNTGLVVSEYENEPEMTDVWAVAQLVRAKLLTYGYRVVFTKTSLYEHINLAQRAAVANSVHAALAVSIHDQAGASGGIGFNAGNNTVYYQAVGDYRETPAGKKIVFTNSALAAVSARYAQVFLTQRSAAEGHPVHAQGNIGYDAGTRGLAPGNIWIVQLRSQVPWIYNEAGGNSAGQVGLSQADKQRYADGLVNSILACVPPK
jgi:N-acetylmuramoyl-L-alanine amidase